MYINAILTFNNKSNPFVEDFNLNIKELNEIKLQSQVFSIPPLYNHLIYRTEELAQIGANGNLGDLGTTVFSGVDAGQLLERFLRDFQKFLDKIETIPAEKAGTISEEITKILEAKKNLASNIATGLSVLASASYSEGSPALSKASAAFKQYLETDITNTYLACVLLQFEASADSSQLTKFINALVKTDQPAFQKTTKAALTLIQQADTYQPSITQEDFLQTNTYSLSYQVEIPVPLIAIPGPPSLLRPEAMQASTDGTQDVKKLTLWNYNFSFIIPQDARDQVIIDVKFNATKSDDLLKYSTSTTDLFSALAQYEFVANELLNILEAGNIATPSAQYVNAVKTFAYLIKNVIDQWSVRSAEPAGVVPSALNTVEETTYQYITRSNYNEIGELISITLSSLSNNNENIIWPALSIKDTAGSFIELKSEKQTDNSVLYTIPEEIDARQAAIQFAMQSLDFEKVTVAETRLQTIRNQELLPGIDTNPLFVLQSNVITTAPVSPTYLFDEPINITKPDSNFATELGAFFTQLFGPATDSKIASVEVSYSYPESVDDKGNAGPIVKIPVALLQAVVLSAEVADEIATTAGEWLDTIKLSTQKAEWIVALKVAETDKPGSILLSISQLVYKLSN